jgi:hypothetical protein
MSEHDERKITKLVDARVEHQVSTKMIDHKQSFFRDIAAHR